MRCSFVNEKNELYKKYHDEEWGKPVYNDRKLFEMLILECFQSGLSFECILNKRENFRLAFDNFDVEKVAAFKSEQIQNLYDDDKIIRHKGKINATVSNAKVFMKIQKEFGSFSEYIWKFTDEKTIYEQNKTSSALSDSVSKDLKGRGMKYVGSVTIYSYLQAIGVIYSHEKGCFLEHKEN